MRSIIFISAVLTALPAGAQNITACYARDYSDAHLAANPAQVVDQMVLAVTDFGSDINMQIAALISDQGHAKGTPQAGQWLDQGLYCYGKAAVSVGMTCAVECDGGVIEVTKVTTDSLTFRTEYLTIGDNEECGGTMELAEEVGKPTLYRLDKVDAAICEGRFQ